MWNSRSSVVHWLWTNNPFYFISALLMLYAVRAAYGQLEVGAINCWVMMGVLAVYTSVLAALGVVLVRWGRVWDDARSILLLLLLLFLAVSVSADDLFVKMESPGGAVALLGVGLAFSILVFQCVLRGAGITLRAGFQIPFMLFLALFYVTPWWCSPELHPRDSQSLDWTVFLFPQVAALLCLTLLPAVRRGRDYAANNGTPWSWPWFPWAAFGFIGGAVLLRSYALSLTFSQTGPIWVSAESRSGIVLDTIWRPYFVAPFVLAVVLLILEGGLASGNRRSVRRVMLASPLMFLIAWPWLNTATSAEFVARLVQLMGSPVWLVTCLMIVFYAWAMFRKVPAAAAGLLGSVALLSVVGPSTVGVSSLVVQPVPLLFVAIALGIQGLMRRSTPLALAASSVLVATLWLLLPSTLASGFRMSICYHVLLLLVVLLSVLGKDRLAQSLRQACSFWLPLSALAIFAIPAAIQVPLSWRLLYVAGLAAVALICAQVAKSRAYWGSFVATTSLLGYLLAAILFRQISTRVGSGAVTAFCWSVGTLIIGALISSYKAGWLPPTLHPGWLAWSESSPEPSATVPGPDSRQTDDAPDQHG